MSLLTRLFGVAQPLDLHKLSIALETIGSVWKIARIRPSHNCRTEYWEYCRVVEVVELASEFWLKFEVSYIDCCGIAVFCERFVWATIHYPIRETEKIRKISTTAYETQLEYIRQAVKQ